MVILTLTEQIKYADIVAKSFCRKYRFVKEDALQEGRLKILEIQSKVRAAASRGEVQALIRKSIWRHLTIYRVRYWSPVHLGERAAYRIHCGEGDSYERSAEVLATPHLFEEASRLDLLKALSKLPRRDADLIAKTLQGYGTNDIAEHYGCSAATASARLQTARSKMRKLVH